MRQTPEESAHLAGFLVSDEAGWITGQTTHRASGRCEAYVFCQNGSWPHLVNQYTDGLFGHALSAQY
jgi:hypothetical protein